MLPLLLSTFQIFATLYKSWKYSFNFKPKLFPFSVWIILILENNYYSCWNYVDLKLNTILEVITKFCCSTHIQLIILIFCIWWSKHTKPAFSVLERWGVDEDPCLSQWKMAPSRRPREQLDTDNLASETLGHLKLVLSEFSLIGKPEISHYTLAVIFVHHMTALSRSRL